MGALLPPVCHLSHCRRLLDLCLLDLTVRPRCLAPLTASGLGAMHQESEGTLLKAGAILRIYLETCSDCIILSHEHFTITREHTFVDHAVELATIGGSEVEIVRQFQTYKQREVFRVAVELKVRVVHSNKQPCLQIGGREEVATLVNANQFSVLFACFLQCFVDNISTIAFTQSFNNLLQIVCTILIDTIVLHLRGCGETTKNGVLTITNRTLAVLISNSKGEAIQSTWAGLTCWQVEDHGLLVEFGVAV